jgi:hypothetical protein
MLSHSYHISRTVHPGKTHCPDATILAMRLRLALAAMTLLATTCGARDDENCHAIVECQRCTTTEGCAWCAETGQCLPSETFCNEPIRQPDLCEEPAAR